MVLNVMLIDGEKLSFTVNKSVCTIGRSGQCDVVIPHESISRKHCQIEYKNSELFVTDLGSINGVLLDGKKITPNFATKFQTFFSLSFGAVQNLTVELPEEQTSIQVNPLLASTLNSEKRPTTRPTRPMSHTGDRADVKKNTRPNEAASDKSMNNFVALCVIVVLLFAFFLFQDEILSFLG